MKIDIGLAVVYGGAALVLCLFICVPLTTIVKFLLGGIVFGFVWERYVLPLLDKVEEWGVKKLAELESANSDNPE